MHYIQGLSQLHEAITSIKRRQNTGLKVAGLLLIKYDKRTNLSKDVEQSLQNIADVMNTKLFKTKIRESVKAREAQAQRMMLLDYSPNSTTANDYIDFTNELTEE